MKIYLAGTAPFEKFIKCSDVRCVLESFYYIKDWQIEYARKGKRDFLLDSGAFTFMCNKGAVTDWDEYVRRYADFIVRNDVRKFFELDIDSVVGYSKVLEYRKKLETATGRQCIPVWHKSRGFNEFKKMCDEYDYVAVGGIVSREIKPKQYGVFPTLINTAHKRKALIHGLGFTNVNLLSKYHFDSVDSTSWTSGGRYGALYKYENGQMRLIPKVAGKRLIGDAATEHNLMEWLKLQRYAERCL